MRSGLASTIERVWQATETDLGSKMKLSCDYAVKSAHNPDNTFAYVLGTHEAALAVAVCRKTNNGTIVTLTVDVIVGLHKRGNQLMLEIVNSCRTDSALSKKAIDDGATHFRICLHSVPDVVPSYLFGAARFTIDCASVVLLSKSGDKRLATPDEARALLSGSEQWCVDPDSDLVPMSQTFRILAAFQQ